MARRFTSASSENMTLGPPSADFAFGTVALIINVASNTGTQRVLWQQRTATPAGQSGVGLTTADLLFYFNGPVTRTSQTIVAQAADGWILVIMGKSTGTVNPRFHKYVYSTNTWTHEDTAGGAMADSVVTGATTIQLGGLLASAYFDGSIAIAAAWNGRHLSDVECESLPHDLMAWYSSNPTNLWLFDQAEVTQLVNDIKGPAIQTALVGTTVSILSSPLSYGPNIIHVTNLASDNHLGEVTLSGNSVLLVNGVGTLLGIVTLSGSSSLLVNGVGTLVGIVSLSGSSVLLVNGVGTLLGEVVMVGNTILTLSSFSWNYLFRDSIPSHITLKLLVKR